MALISVDVEGGAKLSTDLARAGTLLGTGVFVAVRTAGFDMQTSIVAHASGRPGPRAPTGDYRRSWSTVVSVGGGEVSAVVGTNAPQARRLEYGFVGADALGRHYQQPPYPHVRPAQAVVEPKFVAAMTALAKRIF